MNDIVWSDKVDELLSKGISLESMGIKNWALSQQEALQVLNRFVDLQIPILGGDVCEFIDGVIQYNYDSWYCDRLPSESHVEFVSRSIRKTKEYIEHYDIKVPNKIFFTFVPEI
ncbi:MAG: Imm40 family immunity protein [Cruoricaptor ignavus]|nr:Imm40 family immunity protein [Cruoricaptor ignavus]